MNDELLELAAALVEEEGLEWPVALACAQELLPTLTRAAYGWDEHAYACGNTTALDVSRN